MRYRQMSRDVTNPQLLFVCCVAVALGLALASAYACGFSADTASRMAASPCPAAPHCLESAKQPKLLSPAYEVPAIRSSHGFAAVETQSRGSLYDGDPRDESSCHFCPLHRRPPPIVS